MKDKFTSTELLQNTDFIRWLKTGEESGIAWSEWIRQSPDNAEAAQIARSVFHSMKIEKEAVMPGKLDEIWTKIESETSAKAEQTALNTRKKFLYYGLTAAASIILLIGIIWFLNPWKESIRTDPGQTQKVELPDGSVVQVSADSRITFHPNKWKNSREVFLDGEAFFEVKKGSAFRVVSNNGQVSVLGTSFNVRDRNEELSVECYTGKVQVKTGTTLNELIPGQGVLVIDRKVTKLEFDTAKQNWTDGFFEYTNRPLSVVFDEVERQFDVVIQATGEIEALRYSGYFQNKNLENALYSICWPMKLSSSVEGQVVTITREYD